MVLVVGEVAEAETERRVDSPRDRKGCPLENFGGDPFKLIRGAFSCDGGSMVWRYGRRALAERKWRIIDDPILEVY